jgi:hypothetical protein
MIQILENAGGILAKGISSRLSLTTALVSATKLNIKSM